MFDAERARVRALLRETPGKLSFSVDVWTSANKDAFLGITVHWIDKEWCLRDMLLDFVPLSGPHSGENLCAVFAGVCSDFGILSKLLAVTTDNATNNDTFLAELEGICRQRGIRFTKAGNRVRCIAHVINLAVQDFLKALKSEAPDTEGEYIALEDSEVDLSQCISRLRKLIVKIRSSPQRHEKFANQCEVLGVVPKELIIDVKTRWNSTFLMLERALELRELLKDAMCEREFHPYQLADQDWTLLETISGLLVVFKHATDTVCTSANPTLTATIPVYNRMMKRVENFRDTHANSAAIVEATKAAIRKIKYYYLKSNRAIYSIATILDPRFKLEYYRRTGWKKRQIDAARNGLERAFRSNYTQTASNVPTYSREEPEDDLFDDFIMFPYVDTGDELDNYLAMPVAPKQTDVLQWWKAKSPDYPHLASMARDYLAAPATSAPVERVFSGGTDIAQPKRGALHADTFRACLCLRSWLKHSAQDPSLPLL
jgi:hypothetical protein